MRLSSCLPTTPLTLISCFRQVDTNTKNVFGQPRLRASLRDLRSPRKNYKSTIEDDLKKLIIMDNLTPDQERDAGVRSGLRGRARAKDLPHPATPASSCRSLAFDPCQPCLGVCGFVTGIRGITSSVRPEAWCKLACWVGRDLFHTRGLHVTGDVLRGLVEPKPRALKVETGFPGTKPQLSLVPLHPLSPPTPAHYPAYPCLVLLSGMHSLVQIEWPLSHSTREGSALPPVVPSSDRFSLVQLRSHYIP